jgi:hypothetical protein
MNMMTNVEAIEMRRPVMMVMIFTKMKSRTHRKVLMKSSMRCLLTGGY